MKKSGISEKEMAVINYLDENKEFNQRLIAQQAGFSLGLTNLIIKRLVKKGYLKLKQLTHRKIQYMLTPKGVTVRLQRSYAFARRTIRALKTMREQIQRIILEQYQKGIRKFVIKGQGELADLIGTAFKDLDLDGVSYSVINVKQQIKKNETVILLADENLSRNKRNGGQVIDVISILAEAVS